MREDKSSLHHSPAKASMPWSKRLLDLVITVPAVLVLAPFLLVIAIWIKIDSRGPALFVQDRYGRGGKTFGVYKFRSMRFAPESAFVQATQGDSRVTGVGAFIRRTSIDELPQLFNVIKGEMSLVGPRPHPLKLDDAFSERIDGFMNRYNATPGITGLAQISGFRGETRTLEDMQSRFECDLEYIRTRSLFMDLRIICNTALSGWTDKNAY